MVLAGKGERYLPDSTSPISLLESADCSPIRLTPLSPYVTLYPEFTFFLFCRATAYPWPLKHSVFTHS